MKISHRLLLLKKGRPYLKIDSKWKIWISEKVIHASIAGYIDWVLKPR